MIPCNFILSLFYHNQNLYCGADLFSFFLTIVSISYHVMLNRSNHQLVLLSLEKQWKLLCIMKTFSQRKNLLTGVKPGVTRRLFSWLMSQVVPQLRPSHTGSMSGIAARRPRPPRRCPRTHPRLLMHPVMLCQGEVLANVLTRIISRIIYNALTLYHSGSVEVHDLCGMRNM
jgi:hypothetical protein